MKAPKSTLVLALFASLPLVACQQRATHMVEKSGDHASWLGNHQLAAEEYELVVQRQPTRHDIRVKCGAALLDSAQPHRAREHLEVAHSIRPNDSETVNLLARAMVESGRVTEATELLRQRASDVGGADEWIRYGELLATVNDADGAEAALLTAARISLGETSEPQLALARFYKSVQNQDLAVQRSRMSLYLDVDNPEAYTILRAYGIVPGPTLALQPTESIGIPKAVHAFPESRQDY